MHPMSIKEILYIAEYIGWIITVIIVIYPLFYTIASLFKRHKHYPIATRLRRFAILFPAYKEDRIILDSVRSFMVQEYPATLYDIVVISDHMQETTNEQLVQLPLILLKANYNDSTKAKALNLAIDHLPTDKYDSVVILDADNIVKPDFLYTLNNVFDSGIRAIQAHRTAKNRNTEIAILDGISEEINNSIFRRGHVNLGISSALIGSGMAFNYNLFRENVTYLQGTGEDKELEALLLKQRVFIEFLDDVYVFDEKTQDQKGFYNQRQRWIATQFAQWSKIFKELPKVVLSGNIAYSDKLFQWLLPPRLVLFGGIIFMGILMSLIDWPLALKWWGLFIIIGITLCLGIPDQMVDDKFKKSIRKLPVLFWMMVINTFRMKGGNRHFVHTEKKINPEKTILN